MKITITREFDKPEEALDFLLRLTGAQNVSVVHAAATPDPALLARAAAEIREQAAAQHEQPAPKARKPRADAGKPRGAYKPREDARAIEGAEHTTANPEGAAKPSDTSAIATSEPATAPSAAASAAAPSGAAPLTIEDLRALMSKLNATPNKGMPATIGALQAFCVNRVSELPAEKYNEFAAHLRQKIAE